MLLPGPAAPALLAPGGVGGEQRSQRPVTGGSRRCPGRRCRPHGGHSRPAGWRQLRRRDTDTAVTAALEKLLGHAPPLSRPHAGEQGRRPGPQTTRGTRGSGRGERQGRPARCLELDYAPEATHGKPGRIEVSAHDL